MIKKKVVKRIIVIFLLLIFSVFSFYFVLESFVSDLSPELSLKITILFSIFSFVGFLLTIFYVLRDYRKKETFLREIQDFSDMISRGEIKGRVFFEEYPDLAEMYHSLNEITENLKMRFAQTEEERTQLKAIIQSIPDALMIIDSKNDIVFSNDNVFSLFGTDRLYGKSLFEVVRSPDLTDMLEKVRSFMKSESGEIILGYPVERYFQVRVSPLYQENNLYGMVILFQDITELKKLESMRKDFVANVSHEIKTPVTAMKGFAETLLDGAINDKENALKFLHTIKSHSERLNRLVDDLMTLSRIELGVTKLKKTDFGLSDIIDSVMETLHKKATEKGLYLKKAANTENARIHADKDRTIQILLNLIDNAIKFTEQGGIEIGTNHDGKRNYFFVKDTGIGIPKKYLSRLGERFFRVDPSRSRELGGTGLGLAIVKHLIKAHGWEMNIESEVNKGTIIKIFLD